MQSGSIIRRRVRGALLLRTLAVSGFVALGGPARGQTFTNGMTASGCPSEAMQKVGTGSFSVDAVNGSDITGSVTAVSGTGNTRDVTVQILSGTGEFRFKPLN